MAAPVRSLRAGGWETGENGGNREQGMAHSLVWRQKELCMDKAKPVSEMTHEEAIEFDRQQVRRSFEHQRRASEFGPPTEEMLILFRRYISGDITAENLKVIMQERFGMKLNDGEDDVDPRDAAGGHVRILGALKFEDIKRPL